MKLKELFNGFKVILIYVNQEDIKEFLEYTKKEGCAWRFRDNKEIDPESESKKLNNIFTNRNDIKPFTYLISKDYGLWECVYPFSIKQDRKKYYFIKTKGDFNFLEMMYKTSLYDGLTLCKDTRLLIIIEKLHESDDLWYRPLELNNNIYYWLGLKEKDDSSFLKAEDKIRKKNKVFNYLKKHKVALYALWKYNWNINYIINSINSNLTIICNSKKVVRLFYKIIWPNITHKRNINLIYLPQYEKWPSEIHDGLTRDEAWIKMIKDVTDIKYQ